jgi:hypothetical protein
VVGVLQQPLERRQGVLHASEQRPANAACVNSSVQTKARRRVSRQAPKTPPHGDACHVTRAPYEPQTIPPVRYRNTLPPRHRPATATPPWHTAATSPPSHGYPTVAHGGHVTRAPYEPQTIPPFRYRNTLPPRHRPATATPTVAHSGHVARAPYEPQTIPISAHRNTLPPRHRPATATPPWQNTPLYIHLLRGCVAVKQV